MICTEDEDESPPSERRRIDRGCCTGWATWRTARTIWPAAPSAGDRLGAMSKARLATVDAPHISGRMLAVQRQQILERLEKPSSGLLASRGLHASRWIPAAAAAALLAVALFLSRPSSVPQPAPAPASAVVNAETDSELFTDVYSMEQDVEPRAAAPIRALFQEASFDPAASGEGARQPMTTRRWQYLLPCLILAVPAGRLLKAAARDRAAVSFRGGIAPWSAGWT